MNAEGTKIMIAVRGGVVQGVIATDPGAIVTVWDFDDFEEGGTAENKEKQWDALSEVYNPVY